MLTINASTFAGNTTASGGAALNISDITVKVTNSTFANNTAGSGGGAVFADASSAAFINCTITANRVTANSSAVGGGLINYGTLTLDNTIVAGNFHGAGATADDIAGTVAAASAYNLIGTGGAGELVNGTNNNQVGVASPDLGSLANNGGPTQTVALLDGSPAIDKGSNTYVATGATDQRGLTRIVNTTVDIGASEVQTTSMPPANQTAVHGTAATIKLGSFAEARSAGPWTVTINWGDGTAATTLTKTTQGTLGTQTHTYATAGTYTVIVTVKNANNDSSLATFTVVVS